MRREAGLRHSRANGYAWMYGGMKWFRPLRERESTCNVAVVDARSVLVHSPSSPFSVFWKRLRCVWDSISICEWATPGKSDVYFSSHTRLFYNLFWWVSHIDRHTYIEALLQVTKKFLALRALIIDIIIRKCIDFNVYLRIFIRIF